MDFLVIFIQINQDLPLNSINFIEYLKIFQISLLIKVLIEVVDMNFKKFSSF